MLNITNVSKKYAKNSFYSLQDVSLSVNEGDIVGLIGKNGAGKSTLLKVITKAIRPSNGKVIYQNQDIFEQNNVLDEFGIMIKPVFYPYLTVLENLNFYLTIHQKLSYQQNIESILKLVDLWQVRNRKPGDFSFGMKQRVSLALALITEPSFIVLDEPFVGLDPIGVQKLIQILHQWSETRKVSMIISSHQLGELESLCNRYLFIEAGKLRNKFNLNKDQMVIELTEINPEIKSSLQKFASYIQWSTVGNKLMLPKALDNKIKNQIFLILSKGNLIKQISYPKDQLEDYFQEETK
ncbi:ABC transporter ATP-binding protein [Agrilactobacillus fermenti]|uniref:ABC transporter ATP-binding protein n=1 Tax=Agrilactobacillus fermenti TaxID=2586909 RepID=UPI003A5BFAAE